jgi:hypothetical protein
MNPFFRISLDEAVNHPLFDGIRNNVENKGQTVELMFEKMELNINDLRTMILKEIKDSQQK